MIEIGLEMQLCNPALKRPDEASASGELPEGQAVSWVFAAGGLSWDLRKGLL